MPQRPQQSGASFGDLVAIATALWRFVTHTTLGAIIAIAIAVCLMFSLALFATPRAALYMAESKERNGEDEKEKKKKGDRDCLALVIKATEKCLGDPSLPQPAGDLAGGSLADAAPVSVLLPDRTVDGYFESYYGLTVKAWQAAVAKASGNDERTRRRCITQIITDRWGENNTFAAYSGHLNDRDVVKKQIGWFVKPIVRLNAPYYAANIDGLNFAPLAPAKIKETCRN